MANSFTKDALLHVFTGECEVRLEHTSDGRADQVRYGVEEVHDSQGGGEVGRAHGIRCHHRNEGHVSPVEVTVEHRKWH